MSTNLKIGFVAYDTELRLVEQICADANAPAVAAITLFPGHVLSREAIAFDGELIVRFMDEDRDGSGPDRAMNPLVGAEIAAMQAKYRTSVASFKNAKNIRYVADGNEVDNDRYWQKDKTTNGDPAEFGMGYARYTYPIIRSAGYKIIHDGPQMSALPWAGYIKGLKNAAMLTAEDWVSFHAYQGSSKSHFDRVDDWRNNYTPQFPHRRCSTEFGLKLSNGPVEYQETEMSRLYDTARMYATRGWLNMVCHYRVKRNSAPESVPSPFNADGSKNSIWYPFMVRQLKS